MNIDFDEYPCYSGRNSKKFEKNVNKNSVCPWYAYYSGKHKMRTWVNEEKWGIMKTCFPDAKKMPKKYFMRRMYIC